LQEWRLLLARPQLLRALRVVLRLHLLLSAQRLMLLLRRQRGCLTRQHRHLQHTAAAQATGMLECGLHEPTWVAAVDNSTPSTSYTMPCDCIHETHGLARASAAQRYPPYHYACPTTHLAVRRRTPVQHRHQLLPPLP
jgi:hypothetical protein